jgi:transducin (beta)-like 1
MSITSDEVNYLIYRYLQESGFQHSAYTFACESLIGRANINGAEVEPGSLITYIQQGLLYSEIENHITNDGKLVSGCNEPFSLLKHHSCKQPGKDEVKSTAESAQIMLQNAEIIANEHLAVLAGHTNEVCMCSWSPEGSMIASGSADGTCRLWNMPTGMSSQASKTAGGGQPIILQHGDAMSAECDVTAISWSPNGTMMATGCSDGCGRLWDRSGQLMQLLRGHQGPVFTTKFSPSGARLLTASVDKSVMVWNPQSGEVEGRFMVHEEPLLDADWRNDTSFASCSTDRNIVVCAMDQSQPVATFRGHQKEVNAIKWDPSGSLLASCSDDCTAKIWSVQLSKPLADFTEHTGQVYCCVWRPVSLSSTGGNGTPSGSTAAKFLATASFDASVRMWDVESGKCAMALLAHADPVYTLSFSPDGNLLASGSFDRSVLIWDMRSGTLLKKVETEGGVWEVDWSPRGDRVAFCDAKYQVGCFDIRM